MPHICAPVVLTAVLTALYATSAEAQTLSPDEKELATYRLTMPTLKKVMSALESFVLELSKDPKFQEMEKLKAQIKALDEKDELTEAQQADLEKLRERKDALEEEIDRAHEASGLSNPKSLDEMEAGIKKHPAAMGALAREGLAAKAKK